MIRAKLTGSPASHGESTNPPACRSKRRAAIELALVVLIIAAFTAGVLPVTEVPALLILGWLSLRPTKV